MANTKRLGWIGIGAAGVIFSLIISIWFSFFTFAAPVPPYVSYSKDWLIAAGYLILFVFVGILIIFKRYRWLGFSAWVFAGLIILVAIKTPHHLVNLALLVWFLWVSWTIGDTFLQSIIKSGELSAGERAVLGIVLGWGVLVVLTLVLGLLGWYQKWIFYGLFSILAMWGVWKNFSLVRDWRPQIIPGSWIGALGLSLLIIIGVGSFLWALAPAVRYDSLSYHLPVPVRYLEAGRILELPESFQTYFAHYGEMLYVIAFALGDQPLPGLINFLGGILLAIQTYYLGKRLANPTVGWIAAVILYATPLIGIESATTYIDIYIAMFVTAAIHVLLIWQQSNDDKWLLLLGVFFGLALGTKLNAFWLLLPFGVLVFIKLYREQNFTKLLLSMAIPTVLLWSPWVIRDWLWTGNPIFPNLNPIFQSAEWFDRNFFIFQPTSKTLYSIVLFPWLGVSNSYRYYHEAPGAVLGAIPLLSLPWVYGWQSQDRKQHGNLLALLFACLAALAMLFSFGANARYLMPLFPLLSVLASQNLESLGRILFRWRRFLGVAFVILGAVYVFSTRLAFTVRWWEIPERYPTQLWLGRETQDQFINRILPVRGAFEYLDSQGSFKVFSVGNELRLYTNSQIYGIFFSKEAYETLHNATTADELAQNLAEGNYDYVLVFSPEQDHRPDVYTSEALNAVFFERYTRLEYNQRGVEVYRFSSPE